MVVKELEQHSTLVSPDRLARLGVLSDPDKMEALLRMPQSTLAVLLREPVKRATQKGQLLFDF